MGMTGRAAVTITSFGAGEDMSRVRVDHGHSGPIAWLGECPQWPDDIPYEWQGVHTVRGEERPSASL